ncbi:MAG: NADP-dependent oxidoreductase [bacterium]
MKAIGIRRFGGLEVLEKMEILQPKIASHEILVRIHAAGVNPVDVKIRKGLLQGRMPHEFPVVLGWDAAGVVEAVGEAVKDYKRGDEVFAYCRKEKIHDGAYGEFIALEPRHLARKPKNISFEEAAAVPLAGLTAYQSLFESLQLKSGETVLIHAGAGGVGGYALQLAKEAGAHVITTAGSSNHEYVKSLGADEVVDYRQTDFVKAVKNTHPEGIDAVFDTVGGDVQKKSAEVLKPGGRLTSILAIDEAYFRERGIAPGYVFVRPDSAQLNELKERIEKGRLKVKVTETFPLEAAAKAHEKIETGHGRGKIVLRVV